ncbi:reactive intermediate/imine deaminase [Sphingopyxis sp. OAS728]|uniref:RidA family protein n=1 Tax=Sphingopyxis sp. OAS728 TaxID=2663823 RepID=UPI00178BF1D2|nr:RidA family protein [Sphingopyxis sp. OAS728]MBE1528000.1 reactive intermediate/imine deaminase [Sphingopyxis sp. OAS728]
MTSSQPGPFAIPPLSPVSRVGSLLLLSGQIGLVPGSASLPPDIETQTRNAIDNLERVLRAEGCSLADIARVGIYLTDMSDYGAVNAAYAARFAAPFPARTAIGVASLPFGARVELDAIARAKS